MLLKEFEWKHISEILLGLYAQQSTVQIETFFLNSIQSLIPYTQSNFRIFNPKTGHEFLSDAVFLGAEPETISQFYEYAADENDYLSNYYSYSSSLIYVDTDILPKGVREKTNFFKNYLMPQNVPYVCGIIIIDSGNLIGIVNLFRNEDYGDFTEKECYILEIFKPHITNILINSIKSSEFPLFNKDAVERQLDNLPLTTREQQIIRLILKGNSNDEIAKYLNVSLSTVKKHIYNIFSKLDITSKLELLKIFN